VASRRAHPIVAVVLALVGGLALWGGLRGGKPGLTLYAQSVPVTVHPQWSQNPSIENIVSYVVTLDGGSPVSVLASACSATLCTAAVSVPAFGAHVSSVVAQNLLISTDPTSLQTSPTATLNWTLSATGTRPTNLTVKP
jgi:hypothetical protein